MTSTVIDGEVLESVPLRKPNASLIVGLGDGDFYGLTRAMYAEGTDWRTCGEGLVDRCQALVPHPIVGLTSRSQRPLRSFRPVPERLLAHAIRELKLDERDDDFGDGETARLAEGVDRPPPRPPIRGGRDALVVTVAKDQLAVCVSFDPKEA